MSTEALAQYLAFKSPIFHTSNGLSIYVNGDHISTEYKFKVGQKDFSFCLFTEEDNLTEFIAGFRIKNVDGLEDLGYNDIWIRYLNREADMEVTKWKSKKYRLVSGCIKGKPSYFVLQHTFMMKSMNT